MYNNRFPFYPPHQQYYKNIKSQTQNVPNSSKECTPNHVEEVLDNVVNGTYTEHPIFEILGTKIFFDDLLILSILLFLYQEGIEDKLLFISLITLLMS